MTLPKVEYQGIIAGFVFDQVVDVATGGKLSALKKKAGQKILWPLVKGGTMVGARAGLSVAGSAARAAVPLVTNPYLAGALLYWIMAHYKHNQDNNYWKWLKTEGEWIVLDSNKL